MRQGTTTQNQPRQVRARLRMIEHYEQVSRNASQTCRFFGISRTQFYVWFGRYREAGLVGLHDRPRGPHTSPLKTPPHIEALILRVRQERQYGAVRLSLFLQRYHQVYVSLPTILRILKAHHVPRVSLKRYRPGPRRRRDLTIPGHSVQVDVKYLKLGSGRFYQFTAIDEATRSGSCGSTTTTRSSRRSRSSTRCGNAGRW